ncbi:MAG TPA: NADH-quinone oxidoreductase subunit L [Pyrinomonadaceae bacterium]|nr:NADH-quinone oxidoreductase subunit L [Pyrinomonadaceae bacterium]
MHRLIWLIPLLPLAGAAVNGLLGRRLRFSETVVGAIAVSSVALAFLLGVAAVYSYGFGSHAQWPEPYVTSQDGAFGYQWIPGGATELTQGRDERARSSKSPQSWTAYPPVKSQEELQSLTAGQEGGARTAGGGATAGGSILDVEWSYQLDPLSSIFILVITGVGLCIFVFATGYMHGDAGFYRFFAYLGLFMFMMLILVMGSNFLMMFVGWEGVGLCSYLLIGYYFDRKEAGDASRKAFITNRIGDFGFALAVFGIIATFGSTQYTQVMSQASGYPVEPLGQFGLMSWLALGLFVGACGKSAQIPLYVWLPDAMAGPTPVSALIHAATMVTAGLYMLTRTNVIFQHSQTMMLVVAVVGALTALFAATIGITQNDIKKVLAYSTVSQLGFMFLACGTGAFVIGIFHVMTHAFFKALMFLGAGSVIHGMHHEQDMRRMGGLKRYMPKTYWTFLAGWLAICGIIPFSGFWSKDEILWNAASTTLIPYGWLLWAVGTFTAALTAFYMTRLVAMTFWGRERFLEVHAGGQADEAHAHAYDEDVKQHHARTESAGDRPHHAPAERVGIAHIEETGEGSHEDARGRDVHDLHDPHDRHAHGQGHGSVVPHESPPSMWIPLAVLAVLAVVGGFVGISPAFTGGAHVGGRMNIVNWLEPVVWNPSTRQFNAPHGAGGGEHASAAMADTHGEPTAIAQNHGAPTTQAATPVPHSDAATTQHSDAAPHANSAPAQESVHGQPGGGIGFSDVNAYGNKSFNLAKAVDSVPGSHFGEWVFIAISLLAAGIGMFLGWLFYVKRPHLPDLWAARLGALYRASYNKYGVDELYGLLFTRRTMDAARGIYAVDSKGIDGAVNGSAAFARRISRYTGNFDRRIVDGAVNGVAGFIGRLMSPLLRAAQTGLTANYALVMVLGLVVAVVFFFSGDILGLVRGR